MTVNTPKRVNVKLPTYQHPVWRNWPMNAVRMATIIANRQRHSTK